MTPAAFLAAARVPTTILPQSFGLWQLERRRAGFFGPHERGLSVEEVGWPDYTILRRWTLPSLHLRQGEIVMEDSLRELRKHLPIWMAARGRVLKTGLGLGCVVRGLLANPAVDHVDVVEIDADIIRLIEPTLGGDPRVTIHHADALTWDIAGRRWDYAWHDLHSFTDESLVVMHAKLLIRFYDAVGRRQGAWAFPREMARRMPFQMIGSPRTRKGARA